MVDAAFRRCVNVLVVIEGVLVEPGDLVVADTTASLFAPALHQEGSRDALVRV